jgi:DNA modification methylase
VTDALPSLIDVRPLVPYEANTRTHSAEQIEQIKASYRTFGFVGIIAYLPPAALKIGHARRQAALEMWEAGEEVMGPGLRAPLPKWHLPAIDLTGLDETAVRALVIADNKLAENAGWDRELLAAELRALKGLDFDLPVIGFDPAELAALFAPKGATDPDDAPEPPAVPVSRRGDVWLLGSHRLVCGSATDPDDVAAALGGKKPHLMVTDPPYGIEYDADWRSGAMPEKNDTGRWKDSEGGKRGEVENDDRADWGEAWALFPGAVAYVWHAGTRAAEVELSLAAAKFEVRAQIIWVKHQHVISRGDYHPQHEPCLYLVRKGKTGHWQGSRTESTVWAIAKMLNADTGHSTQKPIECMSRPILNNSKAADRVYDPFVGSGTTIIAAEQLGRVCHAIEWKPAYVDVSVLRWEGFAEGVATLEATGQTFAEVKAERLSPQSTGPRMDTAAEPV